MSGIITNYPSQTNTLRINNDNYFLNPEVNSLRPLDRMHEFAVDSIRKQDRNFNHHSDSFSVNRRDGWGSHGHGPGHGHGTKHSPAISALALLAFIFFLHLIQSSLHNNRMMMMTTTTTTTSTSSGSTMMTTTGRKGRVRRKRSFDYEKQRSTPESISTQPNRLNSSLLIHPESLIPMIHNLDPKRMAKLNRKIPNKHWGSKHSNKDNKETSISEVEKIMSKSWAQTNDFLSRLKLKSLECLQLVTCEIGRSLTSEIGPYAGFLMASIRKRFLSPNTRRSWKGRVMRALSYGWRSRHKCNRVFRRCNLDRLGSK